MPKKDGKVYANIHLLVGYNQQSIANYQEMAAELRKTFPQATDKEIHCHIVVKSAYCANFSLITWDACIPAGDYPGWTQIKNGHLEYTWM